MATTPAKRPSTSALSPARRPRPTGPTRSSGGMQGMPAKDPTGRASGGAYLGDAQRIPMPGMPAKGPGGDLYGGRPSGGFIPQNMPGGGMARGQQPMGWPSTWGQRPQQQNVMPGGGMTRGQQPMFGGMQQQQMGQGQIDPAMQQAMLRMLMQRFGGGANFNGGMGGGMMGAY